MQWRAEHSRTANSVPDKFFLTTENWPAVSRVATCMPFLLLWATTVSAQIVRFPIDLDGKMRVRNEADGRDFQGDSALSTYTLLRTRLGARAVPVSNLVVYVQVQDARTLRGDPNTLPGKSNLDLHQAYFIVQNLWGRPMAVQVGRQELAYGNQRVIGTVDFSNLGRSLDGVKLTFGRQSPLDLFMMTVSRSKAPVLGAATPAATAGLESKENNLFGAYYQYRPNSDSNLHLYGLFESNHEKAANGHAELDRATLGTYGKSRIGRVRFETEVGLQIGKRQGQNVRAFLASASVNYTFDAPSRPGLTIGYDYLSGMKPGDKDFKVFDTSLATNHNFYGFMDYFIDIPLNTNGQGLRDFSVKSKMPLAAKWNLSAHYHNFRAARGERKNFGNEFDFILSYVYNAAASLQFGLTFFAPGDLIERDFLNDDVGVWSYTTLLIDF